MIRVIGWLILDNVFISANSLSRRSIPLTESSKVLPIELLLDIGRTLFLVLQSEGVRGSLIVSDVPLH